MKKMYIKYCRPFNDESDAPPIVQLWKDGDKPESTEVDVTLYIYDDQDGHLTNERVWNGIE